MVALKGRMPSCIAWSLLETKKVKFNVDGSTRANPGLFGCEGILRDDCGRILGGFAHCYG